VQSWQVQASVFGARKIDPGREGRDYGEQRGVPLHRQMIRWPYPLRLGNAVTARGPAARPRC
jgi:hypothetical protein